MVGEAVNFLANNWNNKLIIYGHDSRCIDSSRVNLIKC